MAMTAEHASRLRSDGLSDGWIGVDLDGTLAVYDEWRGMGHIGEPVQPMLDRVLEWLAGGQEVRIVTARAETAEGRLAVQHWLRAHDIGFLDVTDRKDYRMLELWDDRARRVETNTGREL